MERFLSVSIFESAADVTEEQLSHSNADLARSFGAPRSRTHESHRRQLFLLVNRAPGNSIRHVTEHGSTPRLVDPEAVRSVVRNLAFRRFACLRIRDLWRTILRQRTPACELETPATQRPY